MKNNELYIEKGLELFKQIEAGDYTPMANEKQEKEKVLAKQTARNTIENEM